MPLQHAHPDVLRAMLRPGNGERYLEILDEFRARVPGITMRSTFIVGFPGRDAKSTSLISKSGSDAAQLDRVGFFEYSAEEGTPAARARRSRQRARAAQAADPPARSAAPGLGTRARETAGLDGSRARRRTAACCARRTLRRQLGAPRAWFGRSQGEAPGVDGGIYFTGEGSVGEFADVGSRLPVPSIFRADGVLEPRRMGKHLAPPRFGRQRGARLRRSASSLVSWACWPAPSPRAASGLVAQEPGHGDHADVRPSARSKSSASSNLLVLVEGLDYDYTAKDEEFSTNSRSDVIWAVNLDFANKRIYQLSIPRDMVATMPNGSQAKINQAQSDGGVKEAKASSRSGSAFRASTVT